MESVTVSPLVTSEAKVIRNSAIAEKVCKFLEDNGIPNEYDYDDFGIRLTITGDWKHDHLRAKLLLKDAGYDYYGEVVTANTGDDFYTADHYIRVI